MITLSLLIAACFTLVSPQLALAQHTALMDLYDALGSKGTKKGKNIFLLTFFHSGCSNSTCPRFAVNQPCPDVGIRLTCSGANVTAL
jgi:hypothetical protein